MECKIRDRNKIEEEPNDLNPYYAKCCTGKNPENDIGRIMHKQIDSGECNDKRDQQCDQSHTNIHVDQCNCAGKRCGSMSGREGRADGSFDQKRNITVDVAGAVSAENRFEDQIADQRAQTEGTKHIQTVSACVGIKQQKTGDNKPDQSAVTDNTECKHNHTKAFGLIALNMEQKRFIKAPDLLLQRNHILSL